jgi:undecaprenyl phosphate-alpha-L-ara4N flippase subunit ArnE
LAKKKIHVLLSVIACTLFTALGQFLMKRGAENLTVHGLLTNFYLIFGVIAYGLGAVLIIYVFKQSNLSSIYPLLSLSFIWVALISLIILKENLSIVHYAGMILIIIGVVLVNKGAKND